MEKKIRKHKVYTRHRSRRYDIITIPEIKLQGKWLDKLGFKQGTAINICQEKDKLIITVNDEHPKDVCEICAATSCLPLKKIRKRKQIRPGTTFISSSS